MSRTELYGRYPQANGFHVLKLAAIITVVVCLIQWELNSL